MKINVFFFTLLLLALAACAKKQEYVAEKLSLDGGENYLFESSDIPKGMTVLWNFGDGNSSTSERVEHSYSVPGKYVVNLALYKNGKLKDKYNKYVVTVVQKYKPRVFNIEYGSSGQDNRYDYFYKDFEAYFTFEENPLIESDNYQYRIQFDNVIYEDLANPKGRFFTGIPLPDTGFVNSTFTVYDENNIGDSFDTVFYIGSDQTTLSFSLPDILEAQLGTIIESHALAYDKNILDFFYDRDRENIVDYAGPSDGVLVNQSQELNDADGSFYSANRALTLHTFSPAANQPFTFKVQAYSEYRDYNELKVLIVLVGNQGIAYGEKSFNVLPGSKAKNEEVSLVFKSY